MIDGEGTVVRSVERTRSNYDVAVVGAGPIGCVTAAAFAQKGASVLLLEANPRAATRFAGEWIHPPGAAVLERLGLAPLEHASRHPACRGFTVFPDDGSDAIELPYTDGAEGVSCEHHKLVDELRQRASLIDGVDYLPFARVAGIADDQITYNHKKHGSKCVAVGRVVGADGRASVVRDYLELPENSAMISYMAGLDLHDVELPHEGYGHVLLGAPGPMLLYRTGPSQVRACIDLPLAHCGIRRDPRRLWDYFSSCLPTPSLKEAFRKALSSKKIHWAATRFRPRSCYGRGSTALVGDAVGHFHPLTATGMTIGFLDAEALVAAPSMKAYQSKREAATYVSELLASALYQVIVREDASASALRSAIFGTWRSSSSERERTMRILAGNQTNPTQFGIAFLKVATGAVAAAAANSLVRGGRKSALPGRLAAFAPWAQWPLSSVVPKPIRSASREDSTAWDPMHGLKKKLRVAASAEAKVPDRRACGDVQSRSKESVAERLSLLTTLAASELRSRMEGDRLTSIAGANFASVSRAVSQASGSLLLASADRHGMESTGGCYERMSAQEVAKKFPPASELALQISDRYLACSSGRTSSVPPAPSSGKSSILRLAGDSRSNTRHENFCTAQLADDVLTYLWKAAVESKPAVPIIQEVLHCLLHSQLKSGAFAPAFVTKGGTLATPIVPRGQDEGPRIEATHRVVRCLSFCRDSFVGIYHKEVEDALALASRWLRLSQRDDGSWGDRSSRRRSYHTALAVESVLNIDKTPIDPAVRAGRRFLIAHHESSWFKGLQCSESQPSSSEVSSFAGEVTCLSAFREAARAVFTLTRADAIEWEFLTDCLDTLAHRFHQVKAALLRNQVAAAYAEDVEQCYVDALSSTLACVWEYRDRSQVRDTVAALPRRGSRRSSFRDDERTGTTPKPLQRSACAVSGIEVHEAATGTSA